MIVGDLILKKQKVQHLMKTDVNSIVAMLLKHVYINSLRLTQNYEI